MTFLDWWVPEVTLEPGEAERWSALANHSVGWRAIGGRLSATDRRLVFRPNRVDRRLGGRVWAAPFAAVREVGRKPPTFHPFDGGLRSRLRVVTTDGVEHLFVVNRLANVIETLARLVPERTAP